MIKRPPKNNLHTWIFRYLQENAPKKIDAYLELFNPVDSKGRYLPYDKFFYRVPGELDVDLAWAVVKAARVRQQQPILEEVTQPASCHFMLTPQIQRVISITDRKTTDAQLEWISANIGERNHIQYLLNDLIQDEAISSSQLEGAATTTIAAKDMLHKNRAPRTPDEKMIIGNFRMMRLAWQERESPLTVDLIRQLHEVGVEGIDDERYTPGNFRNSDDVVIQDQDGNIVHQPPAFTELEKDLEELCNWANIGHDDAEQKEYIHPLIKAIAIHFCIGYEHPFRDGNGRVARALFYWFMFKSGYAAFRYISISVLLKEAAVQYGKSYVYTETDELDLTYFIEYQCSVIARAIEKFQKTFEQAAHEIEQFNSWLYESGLLKKLSDKEKVVLQVAKNGIAHEFTANNVAENLGCSYNTASKTLNNLVQMGLFSKEKQGREWIFKMRDKNEIITGWKQKK